MCVKRNIFFYLETTILDWLKINNSTNFYTCNLITKIAKKEYDFAIEAIESNPSLGGIMGRMFQQNNLLDYALKAYSRALDFNKDASFEYQIAQIYGEKGAYQKMFDSCMELLDKDENYLGGIQRYISRYISDDASDIINISLKKFFFYCKTFFLLTIVNMLIINIHFI